MIHDVVKVLEIRSNEAMDVHAKLMSALAFWDDDLASDIDKMKRLRTMIGTLTLKVAIMREIADITLQHLGYNQ